MYFFFVKPCTKCVWGSKVAKPVVVQKTVKLGERELKAYFPQREKDMMMMMMMKTKKRPKSSHVRQPYFIGHDIMALIIQLSYTVRIPIF